MQLEKRIEKLEKSVSQPDIQVIFCEGTETNNQACERLSVTDEGNIIFVHFVST